MACIAAWATNRTHSAPHVILHELHQVAPWPYVERLCALAILGRPPLLRPAASLLVHLARVGLADVARDGGDDRSRRDLERELVRAEHAVHRVAKVGHDRCPRQRQALRETVVVVRRQQAALEVPARARNTGENVNEKTRESTQAREQGRKSQRIAKIVARARRYGGHSLWIDAQVVVGSGTPLHGRKQRLEETAREEWRR